MMYAKLELGELCRLMRESHARGRQEKFLSAVHREPQRWSQKRTHTAFCARALSIVLLVPVFFTRAEVVTNDWPTGPGEAVLSDKYAVTLKQAGEVFPIEVLMSTSWTEPGGGPDVFRNRTLSYGAFSSSYDEPIVIEIEKLYGAGTSDIEIVPSAYNLIPFSSPDGKKVTVLLDRSRYFSVNFKTADNRHTDDGLITHSLMIFADPLETNIPSAEAPGTHIFSPTTTQTDVDAAEILYFEPGFYDLRDQFTDGTINLIADSQIYIAGGAFVMGKIDSAGNTTDRCRIWGRGVVSGRDYVWQQGLPPSALIEIKGMDAYVEGIFAIDNNKHGVVPGWGGDLTVRNVKTWGWHYNNDGFRPWAGLVDHCFARPTDDAFYVGGGDLVVRDTVIWQSFNGAVVTCGWGEENNPYDTSGFWMTNCHIINPEWNGVGNNNGVLASQLPYSATSDDIHFEKVRVDGNICALTNLKRNEAQGMTVPSGRSPGGITNVTFKDIVVTGDQVVYNWSRTSASGSKSEIRGENEFTIENVSFENVSIGGSWVTEGNKGQYFNIQAAATSNITFSATALTAPQASVLGGLRTTDEGYLSFTVDGEFGRSYRVEYSSDLQEGWEVFGPRLIGFDEAIHIYWPLTLSPGFFRVVTEDTDVPY